MKQKRYRDVIEKFTNEIMEDSNLQWNSEKRRDYILCCIATMLAIIADILEGRNIEIKDKSLHGS